MLRWSTGHGDARRAHLPADLQPRAPFLGRNPLVVTKAEFAQTGFSAAHLRDTRLRGWRTVSTLMVEVRAALTAGGGIHEGASDRRSAGTTLHTQAPW